MTSQPVYYLSPVLICDLCYSKFPDKLMYDAKTNFRGGPWANMCTECWTAHGKPLGRGLGQQYTRTEDGRWLCTGGSE